MQVKFLKGYDERELEKKCQQFLDSLAEAEAVFQIIDFKIIRIEHDWLIATFLYTQVQEEQDGRPKT